jgi:hypothetical protein
LNEHFVGLSSNQELSRSDYFIDLEASSHILRLLSLSVLVVSLKEDVRKGGLLQACVVQLMDLFQSLAFIDSDKVG